MPTRSEDVEAQEHALEAAARAYAQHSGPQSGDRERRTFGHDLHVAALRYARAYYALARELGLIPEYERKPDAAPKCTDQRCTADDCMDH